MDTKSKLSILWVFLVVNYIFCDVFTLMYAEDLQKILSRQVGSVVLDQTALLGFAVVMEIPMLMIVLSRLLGYRTNRVLNIAAGVLLFLFQLASLFVEQNTLHYIFFSVVELSTCAAIVWLALRWRPQPASKG